jgi:DNA-binding transcriptional regulator YiaG
MIRAYDKVYLDKARTALGRMLDFAVYDLNYELADFFELFLCSNIAKRFEKGDFTVLVGKSGVELAYDVIEQINGISHRIEPRYTANRSEEYWVGWALAYYQWFTTLPFSNIVKYVSVKEIEALYSPYHEMDIRHFVDKVNELYRAAKPETNLKMRRMQLGLSQKALSELSGIPVRTLQQYEQRQKNINKAQVEYLLILARILCCNVEDLVEQADAQVE